MNDQVELKLRKFHLIVVLFVTIVVPIFGGILSYSKAMADVDKRFVELRLEREQLFAKKAEISRIEDKLDKIRDDLGEIKGFMKNYRN